jgi:hypothetical protein
MINFYTVFIIKHTMMSFSLFVCTSNHKKIVWQLETGSLNIVPICNICIPLSLTCFANESDLECISMVCAVCHNKLNRSAQQESKYQSATVATRNNLCWRSRCALLGRSCIIAISAAAAVTAQFECTTQSTGAN